LLQAPNKIQGAGLEKLLTLFLVDRMDFSTDFLPVVGGCAPARLIDTASLDQRVQSYLGILSHANQHALSLAIKNAYGIRA
jgi:hypothetical protein